mgnify:CR=1 FL=1
MVAPGGKLGGAVGHGRGPLLRLRGGSLLLAGALARNVSLNGAHGLPVRVGVHARQHGGRGLHAGVMVDMPAHDLAAGAADHKNIPGLEMRSLQQFFRGLPCLRRKFCIIHR